MSDGRRPTEMIPLWFAEIEAEHLRFTRTLLEGAERVVLALRRKLRALDPSLPNEYDGAAWQRIEEPFWDQ